MRPSDSLQTCMSTLRPLAFFDRPTLLSSPGVCRASRFPRMELPHMPRVSGREKKSNFRDPDQSCASGFSYLEKITALNPLCQCQRLELLIEGSSSPISPFTRPLSPFSYAGVATAAACLQRRRIHTQML